MIRRILNAILRRLPPEKTKPQPEPQYKIGNLKYNNSRIDSLIPQFVEIGDNFLSAPGSIILSHDASVFVHCGKYRCQRTVIGDNVFLGANAVVLPGIRIGNGAIIGAGAVVTRNVEAGTVVAGNPAKLICTVSEYIDKCTKRGTLYETPPSFQKLWRNALFTSEDIAEFQNSVLSEEKQRKSICIGIKKPAILEV